MVQIHDISCGIFLHPFKNKICIDKCVGYRYSEDDIGYKFMYVITF